MARQRKEVTLMKIRMHEALRRLNDWTLIAFNDPHALDGARTVQGWPPVG